MSLVYRCLGLPILFGLRYDRLDLFAHWGKGDLFWGLWEALIVWSILIHLDDRA
jgi:hypothetical protein